MKRIVILRRITSTAISLLNPQKGQELIEAVNKFDIENKDLVDKEFYEKFKQDFYDVIIFNETELLLTQKNIEKNTGTIKGILVFYLVCSIIAAIIAIISLSNI